MAWPYDSAEEMRSKLRGYFGPLIHGMADPGLTRLLVAALEALPAGEWVVKVPSAHDYYQFTVHSTAEALTVRVELRSHYVEPVGGSSVTISVARKEWNEGLRNDLAKLLTDVYRGLVDRMEAAIARFEDRLP